MADPKTIALSRLNRSAPTDVAWSPDLEARRDMAERLEISALRKLRLDGRLVPEGRRDWTLQARLGATVVQPCVISLEPVTTRIDIDLTRRYLADLPEPTGEEMEMPEDDSVEALPSTLDLGALAEEALSLALPDFPRAPEAELGEALFAAPGIRPMTDEEAKPLAGLAALRDKLADPERDPETGE